METKAIEIIRSHVRNGGTFKQLSRWTGVTAKTLSDVAYGMRFPNSKTAAKVLLHFGQL